jgi:sortase B
MVKRILFIAALCVFIYSSVCLISRYSEKKSEETILESIHDIVYENTPSFEINDKKIFDSYRYSRQKGFSSLYEQNNDMFGWISIDNTVIDYPVMQSVYDPDFYLKNDFNKNKNAHGSIYMDSNCSLSSRNYILYGHHMKNGTMFASLNQFQTLEYYKEHSIIQFDTFGTLNDYQIIGAFKIPQKDISLLQDTLLLQTKTDYQNFMNYFNQHKFYDTGITCSYEDQYLTLMTCEYTNKNGRFFILAKRIKTEETYD